MTEKLSSYSDTHTLYNAEDFAKKSFKIVNFSCFYKKKIYLLAYSRLYSPGAKVLFSHVSRELSPSSPSMLKSLAPGEYKKI